MRRLVASLAILCVVLPGVVGCAARTRRTTRTGTGIQTIYLVHTSHWDYGFTDPPQNLAALLRTHIDDAVAKCQADTRARYTIEHTWALEEFLSVATTTEIDALMALVRAGRIAVGSGYTGPHSGIMAPEELNRWIVRNKRLREQYQFSSRTAHVDDTPGYTWAMPDALSAAGVDRLVCGMNKFFASEFPLPASEHIFRWRGPGGGQLLTWASPDGYFEGAEFWHIDANTARFFFSGDHPEWANMTNLQIMAQGIDAKIAELEAAGYPYDSVLVLEAFDKMNYDPSGQLLAEIDEWNATHATPRIRLATADEFFDHMESTYGLNAFAVRSGNFTQRWEETKVYSQTVQNRFREMRDAIPAAEAFASVASTFGAAYPGAALDLALRDMMRFDDHGAGCGATQPLEMTYDEMNQTNLYWTQTSLARRDDVRAALASSTAAIAGQIATPAGSNPEVVVFNPLSFARTELATATVDTGGQPFALRDAETGAAVPYQSAGNGAIRFLAEGVPSLGYKRYRVMLGVTDSWTPGTTTTATTIENAFYRVTIDPSNGTIASIVDKTNGNRELVNTSSALAFNRTVRADNLTVYLGGAPRSLIHKTPTTTATVGPVSGTLTVTYPVSSAATGSPLAKVEIRLYDHLKRIDIVDTMDRSRLQYEVSLSDHSQHFYTPLPFAIPVANLETRVDGNAAAPLRPPTATYLSGPTATAVNNTIYPSRGITLRDVPAAFEVQVVSPQVFDYGVGTTTSPVYAPTEATLLAQCMVKQDHTQTDDPGYPDLTFILEPLENDPTHGYQVYTSQFSVTSGAPRPDSQAGAFGASICAPMPTAVIPGGQPGALAGAVLSFFSVDAPNVEIMAVKRPDFGDTSDTIVRVRERDGVATSTSLRTRFPVTAASECTLLEAPTAALPTSPVPVTLGPYETKSFRLRLGSLAAHERDTAGVYLPSTGAWFLRNSNAPGPADVTVVYGPPNVVAISGDWNGDGTDTIGVYDPTSGAFFLKNTASGGGADLVFNYGPGGAGFVPLAGDWNGDGTDTVGLYDPSTGAWFLRNSNSPGPADLVFTYGPPGATPLTGDWNGDGTDTVGIVVAASGAFFLKNTNSPGGADLVFTFGAGGATPLAGDWNGDGTDTIGLYVAASGAFFLRNANASGPADVVFTYGPPSAVPVMGNWDGL